MLDILLVDDHPLMRAGLRCLLDTTDDLHVVGTAADGPQALSRAEQLRPDVVLLDVCMPGMDGIEAARRLCELVPAPAVVMLTTTCAAAVVRQAFAAGACGYLLKDFAPERLVAALRGLADGRPAIDPRVARILVRQRRRDQMGAGRGTGATDQRPQGLPPPFPKVGRTG